MLVFFFYHQIYIWNFKDNNDLVGMAFIDTQMYIHSLVSIKNLIIAADLCKSITLLRLQVTLHFAANSKISLKICTYSCNYLIFPDNQAFIKECGTLPLWEVHVFWSCYVSFMGIQSLYFLFNNSSIFFVDVEIYFIANY